MKKSIDNRLRHYFIVILSVMAFFLIYVYETVHIIRLGYALQKKNDQLFELSLENDALSLELSKLTSLEQIDKIARSKLGLKFPSKDEVILIDSVSLKSKAY